MISNITTKRKNLSYRLLSAFIAFAFSFTSVVPPSCAQSIASLNLPIPGAMVGPSAAFVPVLLKGMTIHPDNPLQFDFIIDSGNTNFTQDQIKDESQRLVKYFLASMTIPKDDLWVNLSPYEKDRIIPDELGNTELGRDMLAQDYILKQLTASLMYPEKELGKAFWDKVYKQAKEKYGTTEIPVDTFNKVWILPETATVYEHGQTVYIVDAKLKVMLDSDYLAMSHQSSDVSHQKKVEDRSLTTEDRRLTTQIVKEIIFPEIEKEVNEGQNFAPLRQIYHSLILAKWYKETIKNSLLSKIYIDQKKIAGVNLDDATLKDQIYAQYMEAYKKGVFNYIKEDYDQLSTQPIPRKYFSGGIDRLTNFNLITLTKTDDLGKVAFARVGSNFELAVKASPQKKGDQSSSPVDMQKNGWSLVSKASHTITSVILATAIACTGTGCGASARISPYPLGIGIEVPIFQKHTAEAEMLITAVEARNVTLLNKLLSEGINVNWADENGQTALMAASSKGYSDIVAILLDKGAKVNIKSENGVTALMVASYEGHNNVVEMLLKKNADVNIQNKQKITALMLASAKGYTDIVRNLLSQKTEVNVQNEDGTTALMLASEHGNFDTVKMLLGKKADVDAKHEDGWTALVVAAQNGHLPTVEILLDKGANINVETKLGWTALLSALVNEHLDVVRVLLNRGAVVSSQSREVRIQALLGSAILGFDDITKKMLDDGVDVNFRFKDGVTALMLASQNGHETIVKMLLAKGADVNARDGKYGVTALIQASQNGHTSIVKMLLEKNADVTIKNNADETALDAAKREGHKNIVRMLSGESVLMQPSKSQEKRIQELINKLGNKDSYQSAKEELVRIGEPAIPQLVQALGTLPPFSPMMPMYAPSSTANGARDTLKSFGVVMVPYLINEIYKTDNGQLFNKAVGLLSEFEYIPRTEEEKIVYYFVTESKNYSVMGAFGSKDTKDFMKLTEIGPAAVPFLSRIAQMDDIGSYSNPIAIGALGALGPAAKEALPELEKLLKTAQPWETNFFYSAISKIGGEDAFRILVDGLSNKEVDTTTKTFIILYLDDVGVKAEQIINILKRMIKEDNREIRIAAYVVLSSENFFKYPGIDQIVFGGLDDPASLVKYNVINFLGSKGTKAAFALPKLRQIVADPKTEENYDGLNLREAAKEAIRRITKDVSVPSGKSGDDGQLSQSSSPIKNTNLFHIAAITTLTLCLSGCDIKGETKVKTPIALPNEWAAQYKPLVTDANNPRAEDKGLAFRLVKTGITKNFRRTADGSDYEIDRDNPFSYEYVIEFTNVRSEPILIAGFQMIFFDKKGNIASTSQTPSFLPLTTIAPGKTQQIPFLSESGSIVPEEAALLVIRHNEANSLFISIGLEKEFSKAISQKDSSSSPVSSDDKLGGIDMNSIDLDKQGGGVDIQFDPTELQEIIDAGIDGFAPVIINITPLPSVLPLLGLEPANKEEDQRELVNAG